MRRILSLSLLICILLAFAVVVFADDIEIPPWQRGSERSTFQRWEFGTSDNPAIVNPGYINPYGEPVINITPQAGQNWLDVYDNRQGVWPLGQMEIIIPNAQDNPDWIKKIWLQLTWEEEGTFEPILLANGVSPQTIEQDILLGGLPGHPWYHTTYLFTLPDNPPFETITIQGNVNIDEIVIDTICQVVPEPSSWIALLGGVPLAGLAWKRRSLS